MTIFGLEIELLTLIPHFYMHELVPTEITPHKGLEILECNIWKSPLTFCIALLRFPPALRRTLYIPRFLMVIAG